jgi:hypothetical protein
MADDTNKTARRRLIALYLCLMIFQVAHVFEEIYGNFRVIAILGPLSFMILNWVFISIPAAIFYFILIGKRWAYYCGIIYAVVLILNGLAHNIGLIITRQYYGGVAGSFTALAFLVIGPLLVLQLRKGLKL